MTRVTFSHARRLRHLAMLASAALTLACGTEADKPYDWTGTWAGPATLSAPASSLGPAVSESGNLQLVLTQSGTKVSGTWAGSSPTFGSFDGSVTGTVTDTTIAMTLSTLSPLPCALSAQGTRSGATMSGTLTPQVCLVPLSGSFSFTKK